MKTKRSAWKILLKTDQVYQYDTDKGELVESPSGTKKPYIVYVLDDNTLEFIEFDSMTGKAKANEIPLFFVKSHEESPYVQDHKTEIAQNSGGNLNSTGSSRSADSNDSNYNTDNNTCSSDRFGGSNYNAGSSESKDSSYQSILDAYTEKMENAVPGLISEYRSEASGVSDITKLAEISNNKISKLAEIYLRLEMRPWDPKDPWPRRTCPRFRRCRRRRPCFPHDRSARITRSQNS